MRISAIVPTLDEARALPSLLASLREHADEVLVCDGGSTDATCAIAAEAGATVVRAPAGRGPQQQAGAEVATGDRLWFVHADTSLAADAGAALRAAPGPWGCYAIDFGSPDLRLRFTAAWMSRRARRTGSCTGDMAMWFDRPFFDALGGFAPLPAFDDLELSDRARAKAPCAVLEPAVRSSPRRWHAHGVTRTALYLWGLRLRYRLGSDPEELARRYVSSNPRMET